jgi:hypothetical protein
MAGMNVPAGALALQLPSSISSWLTDLQLPLISPMNRRVTDTDPLLWGEFRRILGRVVAVQQRVNAENEKLHALHFASSLSHRSSISILERKVEHLSQQRAHATMYMSAYECSCVFLACIALLRWRSSPAVRILAALFLSWFWTYRAQHYRWASTLTSAAKRFIFPSSSSSPAVSSDNSSEKSPNS